MPYIDAVQRALPWQSGSDTSHDAAAAARSFSGRQRQMYLDWLRAKGPIGGTDAEAEVELAMRRSSVCARRNELLGVIYKTAWRRFGCAVWMAL